MPRSVLILAAGRGERMRPLTDTMPKPLLAVAGKPLMAYHLERLAEAGFHDVVVNLAYRGRQIEDWLGKGEAFGLQVTYSHEGEEALETGGGIRHALPHFAPGPFLVINGDVFTDYPFSRLKSFELNDDALAHLVMVPNPPQHPDGDFELADGRLSLGDGDRLTFSGIGLYRPELLEGNHPRRFPLAPLLKSAMAERRVTGERYDGTWDDIGTPERLQALSDRLCRSSVT